MIKTIWEQGFKRIYKKKIKNDDELKKKFWNAIGKKKGRVRLVYCACPAKRTQ